MDWKKILGWLILIVAGLFLAIQLIPYGREHTNPPLVSEQQWEHPQAMGAAQKACYDCHSNQTEWPWYSNVAPISWLIENDVKEGRRILNFSEWPHYPEREEMIEVVAEGEMPPFYYVWLHPEADLSAGDKEALIQSFRGLAPRGGADGEDGDD